MGEDGDEDHSDYAALSGFLCSVCLLGVRTLGLSVFRRIVFSLSRWT